MSTFINCCYIVILKGRPLPKDQIIGHNHIKIRIVVNFYSPSKDKNPGYWQEPFMYFFMNIFNLKDINSSFYLNKNLTL